MPAGVLIHDFSYSEPDLSELSKLLDMKGVKRSEQSNILELYKEQLKKAAAEEEKTGGWFIIFYREISQICSGPSKVSSPHHTAPRTRIGLESIKK